MAITREYPSPTPSPSSISCPSSPRFNPYPHPIRLPAAASPSAVNQTTQTAITSVRINGRKSTHPRRSIRPASSAAEREARRIIKLDVYEVYLRHPQRLLYKRKVVDASKTIRSAGKPLAPKAKVAIDMSAYKNTKGAPPIQWKKGSSLTINPDSPGFDQLTEEECHLCSTLRLPPDSYLHMKVTLLSALQTRGPFKKRDAKSWFRIDVNKTAIVYDWFRALGWLPSDDNTTKHGKTIEKNAGH